MKNILPRIFIYSKIINLFILQIFELSIFLGGGLIAAAVLKNADFIEFELDKFSGDLYLKQ